MLIISFNNYQSAVIFTSANNVAGNIYSTITDIGSYFSLKSENTTLMEYNRTLLDELEETRNELRTLKEIHYSFHIHIQEKAMATTTRLQPL